MINSRLCTQATLAKIHKVGLIHPLHLVSAAGLVSLKLASDPDSGRWKALLMDEGVFSSSELRNFPILVG